MEIRTGFQNTLGHIRPQISQEVQAEAARGVAERLLGTRRAGQFMMVVEPGIGPVDKDTFLVISISRYNNVQMEIQSLIPEVSFPSAL